MCNHTDDEKSTSVADGGCPLCLEQEVIELCQTKGSLIERNRTYMNDFRAIAEGLAQRLREVRLVRSDDDNSVLEKYEQWKNNNGGA